MARKKAAAPKKQTKKKQAAPVKKVHATLNALGLTDHNLDDALLAALALAPKAPAWMDLKDFIGKTITTLPKEIVGNSLMATVAIVKTLDDRKMVRTRKTADGTQIQRA
jgi:hypothetical protein